MKTDLMPVHAEGGEVVGYISGDESECYAHTKRDIEMGLLLGRTFRSIEDARQHLLSRPA